MSLVSFDRHGMARPALIVRPLTRDPEATQMLPDDARPTQIAKSHPAVAVLGKMADGGGALNSLMFVLEDGFLLELPLDKKTVEQMRDALGTPTLPDDDPELTKPSWA
mgnify:CR=1 FL=1|jgi:hypothetical protein